MFVNRRNLVITIFVLLFILFLSQQKLFSDSSQDISDIQNVKGEYTQQDITPSPIPSVSPSSEPTSIPTILPSPKYDGTRTGGIIKYKEWCKNNQEISIYENELITKQASDGNTFTMTQGDWDCYEKYLVSKRISPPTYPTPYISPYSTPYYNDGGLETAWIVKDIDNGDNVIIERSNGEQWLLEAYTWCSWCWLYEGRQVYLKFGYVSSKLINDNGDVVDFWTEDEI